MAGKQSCFACHAVAASSTEIPSSSSPSLSAKSSPCFLALAPRDQTRGDRTKRKTKGKQNKTKTKTKKHEREFKNSMTAEMVGPGLCPTALLATHTAPLPEPVRRRARAGQPRELRQDAASPGPLPRSSLGRAGVAGRRRAGLGQHWRRQRVSLSKHSSALLHPSLAPTGSHILGSLHRARLPLLLPGVSRSPAPSSAATRDSCPLPPAEPA